MTEEKEKETPDVDDTDGLDPAEEFEQWRLRELGRIKRDKEKQIQLEQEREEIERRRALPEEQRMKEDLEHANSTREEKPKGQQKFLQKYWHKGAFFQASQFSRLETITHTEYFDRTKKSCLDMTLLKLRNQLSMSAFCHKSCKSGTLESEAAQSIHIWWTRTLPPVLGVSVALTT